MLKLFQKRLKKRKILRSGLFDPAFYLHRYPDVAASGVDPLVHFLNNGGREARSPSALFDGPLYVLQNPGARNSENLLLDWLREGKRGRRVPPQPLCDGSNPLPLVAPIQPVVAPALKVSSCELQKARQSGLFDMDHIFSAHPDLARNGINPLEHYLTYGWRENRSISAEFDGHYVSTVLAKQRLGQENITNPLLDYIEHGQKMGVTTRPENSVTLSPIAKNEHTPSRLKIAIQLHLYYSDMIEIFHEYLKNAKISFDLLISTATEADARFIRNFIAANFPKDQTFVVRVTPNRGRDIAPFLIGFSDLMGNYDYICHLHSKRSPHAGFGENWLAWVLRCMFGAPWIAEAVLSHMESNPECCVMFPDNYFEIKTFTGWGGNEIRITALLKRWGLSFAELPVFANFAAGSMAWFRASCLQVLADTLSLEDFEQEAYQEEGTLAHVLERAIPLAFIAQGKSICRYYLDVVPAALEINRLHGRTNPKEPVGDRWMRDTPAIARNSLKPLAPLSRIFNKESLQISWIIPDFGLGAGGHMTIFRMVQFLEQFGHQQTIWIQNARNYASPEIAKMNISNHYRKLGSKVHVRFLPDDVRQLSGDAIIATDCWTAFPVGNATFFKERFYFIQDYEPYFHPMGENYIIAESTYSFGFSALCAGQWLLGKAQEHGMWARSWELAVDREHYFPPSLLKPALGHREKKIVFYARSYTPRRAVSLGIAAFEELFRRRRDFVVEMFGEDSREKRFAFPNKQLGILSPAELGGVYREADLGVSFSTTNYSLVPLEMMACGTPVVEINTTSARAAFPTGSVAFSDPSPQSVADHIEKLLDEVVTREEQKKAAFAFVDGLDWETSARSIERAIIERLDDVGYQGLAPAELATPAIVRVRKASVIIPTYNGGDLFRRVLKRATEQSVEFDYDVLVVDSSSTDGTNEFASKFGGRVRCETIEQTEFQHGKTRNLAIQHTDGEVVAVLTQDAMPQNEHWLRELVAPFDAESRVVGAVGRHRAYPEHNRLVARDLDAMFDRFRDLGPYFSIETGLPSFIQPGGLDWRMIMHFYSDNNSAMRRSFWNLLPYPEIEWGEDQVWCWEMQKLGLWKAYADNSVVWHSHDINYADQINVSISEAEMFAHFFGYRLSDGPMNPTRIAEIRRASILYATSAGIPLSDAEAYTKMQTWSAEGRAIGQAGAKPDREFLSSDNQRSER
jgi:glycosyltransferase involved in cell wall biosynthesis